MPFYGKFKFDSKRRMCRERSDTEEIGSLTMLLQVQGSAEWIECCRA